MDTHTAVGVVPCWGLSQRLSRVVGANRARFMSLTASKVDAKTAYEYGLLAQVVEPDELMPTAIALGEKVASLDQDVVSKYKRTLNDGLRMSMGEALVMERERARRQYAGIDTGAAASGFHSKL